MTTMTMNTTETAMRHWLVWPVRAWARATQRLELASHSPRLLVDMGLSPETSERGLPPTRDIRETAQTVIAWDRAAMQ